MRTISALVLLARVASADPTPPSTAEDFYDRGQLAFDAGRFGDAIAAWEQSYMLSNEPALLFDIGQAYRERDAEGDCTKAHDAYVRFLELDGHPDRHDLARGFASATERCAVRPPPTLPTPTIVVPMQSNTVVELPQPGRHHEPSLSRSSSPSLAIAVVAGGVAMVVTGVYFGHRASELGTDVTAACATSCDWSAEKPIDTSRRHDSELGWSMGATGVAAMAGGAVLYFTKGHEPPVMLRPRADGAELSWGGSW